MQIKRTIATAIALAALSAPAAGARVPVDAPVKDASTEAPVTQSGYAGIAAHRETISSRQWEQAHNTPVQPLTLPRAHAIERPSPLTGATLLLALLLVGLLGRTLVSRRTSAPSEGGAAKPLKHLNAHNVLALTALGAIATVGAGVALATPGAGFKDRTVVARGTLAPQFKIKLRKSSSPGDVVMQKFILAPGGQSGWHHHPGAAVVTIKSGELTLDQEDCSSTTYSAGQVAVEQTGDVHRVRNVGATDLEFWVTFLDIPVGSPQRLEPESDRDWVEPDC